MYDGRKAVVFGMMMVTTGIITASMAQTAGFHISGRKVLDARNNEFIMRGVNHAHTWYESQLTTALDAIVKTKSNCVRVVLSNGKHAENWGKNSASEVKNIITLCKEKTLIPVLEVHDCTGYPEKQGAVTLSTAVDYWLEMKNELIGQEGFVIINIANEPFGNNVPATTWKDEHISAIKRLRNGGLKHLLMVDAANWGQDWEKIMQANAQEVFDADPDKNVIFSIHMYEVFKDAATVDSYLNYFVNKGLPLLVGEFAANHGSDAKDVDEATILKKTKEYGLGYIGWSWKGNSSGLESLDIARDWNGATLTTWGDRLINGADGIKATAQVASVFSTNITTYAAGAALGNGLDVRVNTESATLHIVLIPSITHPAQVTITDLNGKVWLTRIIPPSGSAGQSLRIAKESLATGTYVLNVAAGGERFSTQMHITQ